MNQSRRNFLLRSGCALGMASLATQARHFGLMNAMASTVQDNSFAPGDYKALVCIFMSGGNDGNNTVIPNHSDATLSNYNTYFTERNPSTLAIPQASLLPINVPRMGGLTYGLHPSLGVGGTNNGIHELWGLGKLAVVTNVGTLVAPMTRTQYQNNSVPKPYQLYSHSDQVAQYQSARSNTAEFTGWGGKVADRMNGCSNPGGLIPMITSISGVNLFTNGQTTVPMAIAPAPTGLNQVLALTGFNGTSDSNARLAAFNQLRTFDLESEVVKAASNITSQAVQANQALASFQEVTVVFPNTTIGNQLKQVARLIKKRSELTVNRQIFFCQIGGFDTHTSQPTGQVNLLSQLGQALRAFYDEMTAQSAQDNVTAFTVSDFSRTFAPVGAGAGAGTDHAWANHMLVMGGAVLGGDFYGMNTSNGTPYPQLVKNGPDDADSSASAKGRWIPTTSVEQYAATLARWYGLDPAQLSQVFPNINNFSSSNLGFMPASSAACA
ncbi:MAG TPA: DUF1501 domain-containing protein [Pyrinomonadaceae bacterium]|nr:DUF1501 domain-containing protein [Pyrinomonadaceae bacterium]